MTPAERSGRPPLGSIPETRGMTMNWAVPFYDRMCRALGLGQAFRRRTMAAAGLRPGQAVLDVGCGTGVLTRLAAEAVGRAGRAVGIDPTPGMIRVALEEARRLGSAAEFELGVVEGLRFEPDTFDIVFASMMLHHLPADLKRAGLREIRRVLRPGGRFVAVDLDRPARPAWWLVIWPMLLVPSVSVQLRGELDAYLREAGFDPVERVGRWRGLLAFWTAAKPGRATSGS